MLSDPLIETSKKSVLINISNKLDELKIVLHNNINNIIVCQEKLDILDEKTAELNNEANVFNTNAKKLKNKLFCSYIKFKFIYIFLSLIIMSIMCLIIYCYIKFIKN